jgi:filamentous hemagglutinin
MALLGLLNLHNAIQEEEKKKQDELEVDEEGDPPENMSPPGAGRKGAFGQAKRNNGIPVSKQPDRVGPNKDKRGVTQLGRSYEYDMPNGTTKTIRDDVAGHNYGPSSRQNRGSHFNDDAGRHYDY